MIAEISQALHEIVANHWTWRRVVDNKCLTNKIGPDQFGFLRENMTARKYREDSFRPQLIDLAFRPVAGPSNECHVKMKLSNCGGEFGRVAVDELYPHTGMGFAVGSEQIGKEARV